MPFAIIDAARDDLYINRTWNRRSEAEWERAELLYGYPPDNEWHRRLQVVPWEYPSTVRMRKLPKTETEK